MRKNIHVFYMSNLGALGEPIKAMLMAGMILMSLASVIFGLLGWWSRRKEK